MTRVDKQIDFDWNSTSPEPGKLDPKAFLGAVDRYAAGSRARRL